MTVTPESLPAHTEVWTDGSAKHGIGGWGWVTPDGRSDSGGEMAPSTNQRMEIAAALAAVTSLSDRPLMVVSDSAYVVNCFKKVWWKAWVRDDAWLNASKQPVANRDLWEPLVAEVRRGGINFRWVKGHAGHALNEQADGLAEAGRIAMGGTANVGFVRTSRPRARRRTTARR